MDITATHATTPRATPSLGWFVSLSILLHMGLLWGLLSPQRLTLGGEGEETVTSLAVQLQPRSEPKKTQAKARQMQPHRAIPPSPLADGGEPRPKRIAKQAITTQAVLAPTVETSVTYETAEQRNTQVEEANVASATINDEAALQEQLRITLQQTLANHFSYPLLARRRGWQGEVVLSFRLEADGRILDARIARSSGYGVLDHAALSALGKVKRLQQRLSRSLTMQLPVIYRLEG